MAIKAKSTKNSPTKKVVSAAKTVEAKKTTKEGQKDSVNKTTQKKTKTSEPKENTTKKEAVFSYDSRLQLIRARHAALQEADGDIGVENVASDISSDDDSE